MLNDDNIVSYILQYLHVIDEMTHHYQDYITQLPRSFRRFVTQDVFNHVKCNCFDVY